MPKIYFFFDLEWWEATAALVAWLLPRSGTQDSAALVQQVKQMLPQPSYLFITFGGAKKQRTKKNVSLRGAQSRRGPAWDGHRQWQGDAESPHEGRDASAFLTCSKCDWWHPCEPTSLQHCSVPLGSQAAQRPTVYICTRDSCETQWAICIWGALAHTVFVIVMLLTATTSCTPNTLLLPLLRSTDTLMGWVTLQAPKPLLFPDLSYGYNLKF